MNYTIGQPGDRLELLTVLEMQLCNHKAYLRQSEWSNGYVTLITPMSYLTKINTNSHLLTARYPEDHPHACRRNGIAGYVIWVNQRQADKHPFLSDLSKEIKRVMPDAAEPAIIAQVGVQPVERGRRSGIGTQLYEFLFDFLRSPKHAPVRDREYSDIVTEVSVANETSLRFHLKMGFKEAHRYKDTFGNEMCIVRATH